ncbi:DNA-directed RNA polymerase, subunit K/omega [Candidatus Nitrososphaera evergladensis SR1]|uniref:DNA-directed RNA polymerase subunit Rpo6 n=1 Tax=Candidatus Nitrososphaera evergladensis SR1 TaxID=1459636 RepID=A0A075MU54_9ARCH|nr:DNA-directed RNA polymerase subunit K [Candidatus Nitrososphaera evergladensis]AIF84247.1 DNA-directed RNA polymerase, subunit K/omega [Candidatus Nitrososphaera evergladensis SR1]
MVIKRFTKKPAARKSAVSKTKGKKGAEEEVEETKKSNRPADEVVTYSEQEYELKEVPAQGNKILIGLPWLTRFERARITGARALQLSLGAPPLIKPDGANTSIALAMLEVEKKALPISIRRILPNGMYQDIPIDWMK